MGMGLEVNLKCVYSSYAGDVLLDSCGSGWDWYQASALAYIKQAHTTIHNSSLSSDEQQLL